MEEGMMMHFYGQIVYRGIAGTVCLSWSIGNTMLSPPVWQPAIEKMSKYETGKGQGRLDTQHMYNAMEIQPTWG
jgi:hypothetical protein